MKKFRCMVLWEIDSLAHGLTDRCGQNHCIAAPTLHVSAFSHQVTWCRYPFQKPVYSLTTVVKLFFACGVWGNPRVKFVPTVTWTTEAAKLWTTTFNKPPHPPPHCHSHPFFLSLLSSLSRITKCLPKLVVERLTQDWPSLPHVECL